MLIAARSRSRQDIAVFNGLENLSVSSPDNKLGQQAATRPPLLPRLPFSVP